MHNRKRQVYSFHLMRLLIKFSKYPRRCTKEGCQCQISTITDILSFKGSKMFSYQNFARIYASGKLPNQGILPLKSTGQTENSKSLDKVIFDLMQYFVSNSSCSLSHSHIFFLYMSLIRAHNYFIDMFTCFFVVSPTVNLHEDRYYIRVHDCIPSYCHRACGLSIFIK